MLKTKTFQVLLIALIISSSFTFANTSNASSTYSGKIFLQTESHGEAWYIYPVNNFRYYLGRPLDAFNIMRNLGLGISEKNIQQIPIGLLASTDLDTDNDGLPDDLEKAIGSNPSKSDSDNDDYSDKMEIEKWFDPNSDKTLPINTNLIKKLSGRILLQVEKKGEAWYLNPNNNKRYYLGRPQNAFDIMSKLGIGITNANLAKIPENYTKQNYDVADLYQIKYPSSWTVSKNTTNKEYKKIPIIDETRLTPTSGSAVVVFDVLEDLTKDKSLGNLTLTSKHPTTRLSKQDLIIENKPAVRQQIFFLTNFDWENFKINRGSEITVDIMLSTHKFIHVSMVIFNEADIEMYEKYFDKIINDIKLK